MHLSGQGIIVILVVGIIAGWIAGLIVSGGGFGIIGDFIVGIIGAFIGDYVLNYFHVHLATRIAAAAAARAATAGAGTPRPPGRRGAIAATASALHEGAPRALQRACRLPCPAS